MNVSKSSVLPLGKSSLPLPDVVLEPIQLTDPAKKIVCFLKAGLLLSSARRQFSRILTSLYKKKNWAHKGQAGGWSGPQQSGHFKLLGNHRRKDSFNTESQHGKNSEKYYYWYHAWDFKRKITPNDNRIVLHCLKAGLSLPTCSRLSSPDHK